MFIFILLCCCCILFSLAFSLATLHLSAVCLPLYLSILHFSSLALFLVASDVNGHSYSKEIKIINFYDFNKLKIIVFIAWLCLPSDADYIRFTMVFTANPTCSDYLIRNFWAIDRHTVHNCTKTLALSSFEHIGVKLTVFSFSLIRLPANFIFIQNEWRSLMQPKGKTISTKQLMSEKYLKLINSSHRTAKASIHKILFYSSWLYSI